MIGAAAAIISNGAPKLRHEITVVCGLGPSCSRVRIIAERLSSAFCNDLTWRTWLSQPFGEVAIRVCVEVGGKRAMATLPRRPSPPGAVQPFCDFHRLLASAGNSGSS